MLKELLKESLEYPPRVRPDKEDKTKRLFYSVEHIMRYGAPYGEQTAMRPAGNGLYNNNGNPEASVTFFVHSPVERTSRLSLEYGSPSDGNKRGLALWVNGQERARFDVTKGNGWFIQAETEEVEISLQAGENKIKVSPTEGSSNLRGIYLSSDGSAVLDHLEPDTNDLILLPGEEKELHVFAVYTDGSRKDVTNEASFGNVSPKISVTENRVTGKAVGTGVVELTYREGDFLETALVRVAVQQTKNLPPKTGGPVTGAYLLTFFDDGITHFKKVFFYAKGKFGAYSYNNIDETREIMKNLKEAGIDFVILDMTNTAQWHTAQNSFVAIANIETVAAELGMKLSFLLGGSRDNDLDSFNQRAKYIWEHHAQKPTYQYYQGKPLLLFFTVPSNEELAAFAPEARDYIDKFYAQSAARTEYGYRSMATDPEGKVRYAQPNPGIDPGVSDWGRVSPKEWHDRVVWASQAEDMAIFGGYDDLHDGLYWGIADSKQAYNPDRKPDAAGRIGYSLHHAENTDPWDYYNIVKDVLVESRARAKKEGDCGLSAWAVKDVNAAVLYGLATEETLVDFQRPLTLQDAAALTNALYFAMTKTKANAAFSAALPSGRAAGQLAVWEDFVPLLCQVVEAMAPTLDPLITIPPEIRGEEQIAQWLTKQTTAFPDGETVTCQAALSLLRRAFDDLYLNCFENHTRIKYEQ